MLLLITICTSFFSVATFRANSGLPLKLHNLHNRAFERHHTALLCTILNTQRNLSHTKDVLTWLTHFSNALNKIVPMLMHNLHWKTHCSTISTYPEPSRFHLETWGAQAKWKLRWVLIPGYNQNNNVKKYRLNILEKMKWKQIVRW